MKIYILRLIKFLTVCLLVTFVVIGIHTLAGVMGITTYSGFYDGMPFYYENNYFDFALDRFLGFLSMVLFFTTVLSINIMLSRMLVEFLTKKKNISKNKNLFRLLLVYTLVTVIFFEFLAKVSLTGPSRAVPMYDLVFRFVILFVPAIYFWHASREK